jgi:hypothetical protein
MFSITPKAFNPIDVVSAFGTASLFSNHDMLTTDRQRSIGVPVIRVIKTARRRMLSNQRQQLITTSAFNSKDLNSAITLKDAKDQDFACGSPTTLAFTFSAKKRLITLDAASKGLLPFFGKSQHFPTQAEETLGGFQRDRGAEAQAISWDTEHEVFEQSSLSRVAQAGRVPHATKAVALTTATTFSATVTQVPEPVMAAFYALSFHHPSKPDFSPV